jgi:SLT domain-containing protein
MQVGNYGIKITSNGIQKTINGKTWVDINTIIE